jgi:hypothetical protein
MSMMGNYLRVTPDVLADLKANPDSILDFLYPDDGEGCHPEGRYLDIDRSWHAIHFLLNGDNWGGDPPLFGAVLGGTPIGEVDIGYGPARFLSAEEVQIVADALHDIPAFQLLERFDADDMKQEEIYPHGWSGNEKERQYISDYYLKLVAFFIQASQAGDAMILYLS